MLTPAPELKAEYKAQLEAHGHMSVDFREALIAATLQKRQRSDWDQVKLNDLIHRNAAHLPDPKTRRMGLFEQRIRIEALEAIPKRNAAQEQALKDLYEYNTLDDVTRDERVSQRDLVKIRLVCGNI